MILTLSYHSAAHLEQYFGSQPQVSISPWAKFDFVPHVEFTTSRYKYLYCSKLRCHHGHTLALFLISYTFCFCSPSTISSHATLITTHLNPHQHGTNNLPSCACHSWIFVTNICKAYRRREKPWNSHFPTNLAS
jgi:hypothetical protein